MNMKPTAKIMKKKRDLSKLNLYFMKITSVVKRALKVCPTRVLWVKGP